MKELTCIVCPRGCRLKVDDNIICLMLKHKEYGKVIKEHYGNKYKLVAVRRNNPYADVYIPELSPLEWSRIFKYAKLTVTDFFHGSLLSLKNNTPVVSIDTSGYNEEYESKAYDLFNRRLFLPEMYMEKHNNDSDELVEKCEYLLNHFDTKRIKDALEKEGKSFNEFCEAIKQIYKQNSSY